MVQALSGRHVARTDASVPGAAGAMVERLESRTLFSATPAATAEELVAQANNAFAFDLLHQLPQDGSGNLFFSPYSAATALEMALQGANGVTASEIIKTLDLPSSELAQAGIQALYQLFQATPATAGYTLSTANRLWINDNFPVLESFISSSQNVFDAGPQSVNFADPQAAANTINAWVADQTDGKITNLIPASDLSAYTGLVLTNAIYFQGNWADAFDPGLTKQTAFQISSTQASTVEMMQQTNDFGYYAQGGPSGFQALDLPYAGNNLDMLIILPATYDLDSFQSTLTSAVFSQITSNLTSADVDVSLPRFQFNETYDLVAPLESLGIQTAFNPITADFSGISSVPLYISDVVQKSFVDVDETGTQAAAATGVGLTMAAVVADPPPPVSFDADHPFLFAIRDNATNTILFLGSVSDPSNGTTDYVTSPATLSDPIAPTAGAPTGLTPAEPVLPTDPSVITPIGTTPLPGTDVVQGIKTSDLSIRSVVGRTFNGTVGVLSGVVSHVPKLADLSGTIEWGDGSSSPASFVRLGGKIVAVRGSHVYADAGSYAISIDVTQTPYVNGKPTTGTPLAMPAISATATITARSGSPSTAAAGAVISATAGETFTATLASGIDLPTLPASATRGVTIHWGDGSSSAGTLTASGAAFAITASHLYRSHGQYPVLIDVWQKSHGKLTTLTRVKATASVMASAG